jgi:radical SAM protein with 4Fe4S-binding SPASM domain
VGKSDRILAKTRADSEGEIIVNQMNLKRFKKIYIEITNVCNLRCSFCPESNRLPGFMPFELFTEIIKKISGHTDYVYLHVKGEPLLHPQLSEILDLCFENKLHVNLVTNGTLLADKGDLLLSEPAIRQINISLHCFSELHHIKDKDDYIRDVMAFTKKAISQSEILISLRLWNIEKANQDIRRDNQIILNIIEQEFVPGSGLMDTLKPGKGLKLKERLFVNSDFEFSWPGITGDYDSTVGSCYGLRDQLGILCDGSVVPCCLDAEGIINLGNIRDNEIQQIFETNRAQKIYYGFLHDQRIEPLCRKCRFNKRKHSE